MKTSIRVISLIHAQARRDAMTQRLADTGLEWSFFDAHRHIAPGALTYCENDAWIARGRPLVAQELGCYSSHYSLWQEFLAGTATQLLVLEDDALGDWEYIKTDVLSHDFGSMGIHLLRLYAGYPARYRQHGELKNRSIVQLFGYIEGALAYIISRQGAEKLLKHCQIIRQPIDDEMDRGWIHGVQSFALFPYPVMELQTPTQILNRAAPHGKNPHEVKRYCYRVKDKVIRLASLLKESTLKTENYL